MRWVLPSVLLVSSLLACSIGTPTPPAPVADVPTATLPAAAAPPTEQPPTPVSVATATLPPPATPDPTKEGGHVRSTPTPADQPPPLPTPTPTIPGLWLEDRFENPDNDRDFDRGLWTYTSALEGPTTVEQKNGFLTLSRQSLGWGGLNGGYPKIGEIAFFEAKVMLDDNIKAPDGGISIQIDSDVASWLCGIFGRQQSNEVFANCYIGNNLEATKVAVQYNSWHTLRFEVNPATAVLSFLVDGQPIGSYVPPDSEAFKQAHFNVALRVLSDDGGLVTGYVDDVRVGKAQAGVSEVDPALYDDFNDERYEGTVNPEKWGTGGPPSSQIEQQNGVMVFTLSKPNPGDWIELHPIRPEFWTLEQFQFIEAKLLLSGETETTGGGEGSFGLGLSAPLKNNRELLLECQIAREEPVKVKCYGYVHDKTNQTSEEYSEIGVRPTSFNIEHIVRIEVDPQVNVTFFIDGEKLGSYRPAQADEVKDGFFKPIIWIYSGTQDSIKGYADDVRIGRLGQQ